MQAQLREVDAAAVGIRVVYPTEESTVRHRRYFRYETPSGCDRCVIVDKSEIVDTRVSNT